MTSLRRTLEIGGLAVLLSAGVAGCQDECNGVIGLCWSDLYVSVDVAGATVTPIVGDTTPPALDCRSTAADTSCHNNVEGRLAPGTYVYEVAWAGHVRRVSVVMTDQSGTCCRRSMGSANVSFLGDAGP